MKIKTIFPLAIVPVLLSLAGCQKGGGSSEILATVGGEPITVDQFNNYLGVKGSARVVLQGQVVELPVSDTLAFQAMQDLVSRTILTQMAKEGGVLPSKEDVDKELKFQEELDPNFMNNYQRRGMTVGQIRDEIRFSLIQEGLITKGIKVSDEEVDAWLKRNPEASVKPAAVELSWILATTDVKKTQADQALKAGQKFEEVAVKFSQAPNAAIMKGKYLPDRGPLPINQMTPNLRTPIETTPEGGDTPWIKFTEGWAKFHVDKKTAAEPIKLTDARKESVRRNLAIQRGNKANDLRKTLIEKLRTSEVVVRRESLKEAWKNFSTLLQKQAEQAAEQASGSQSK
ncbi:MAG: SurA N-terminal domain-containing protein [Armatimonadetes bacterium]|nr:SurA N-terminal domain-containing protein [Armatimonadota bacterium]